MRIPNIERHKRMLMASFHAEEFVVQFTIQPFTGIDMALVRDVVRYTEVKVKKESQVLTQPNKKQREMLKLLIMTGRKPR